MKKYLSIALLAIVVSCKSTKGTLSETRATTALTAEKIIENHYNTKRDFKTLYIKADVSYEDNKQSQHANAEIKIKKDEKILISIRVLGITMAKGLITPTEVKYYDKLNGKFFEGDYTTLSKWLGTDLDFFKLQHILLGQAMDDLTKGKYKATIEDQLYKLELLNPKGTQKDFYFEASQFLTKKQDIEQPAKNRMLHVTYPNYKEYPEMALPSEVKIEAFDNQKKTSISIEYNSATFNEEISFPYSAPDGYERVNID
ncbi:MAG: hypothetical protein CFE23_14590 [Flavobacterium sp. BFFFF1]|uniref:DUF4292 domain-containing protein n=1 Tax=Flavobacterium sp. BFFFF1 TaxID=2015557 RepID=UPI000BD0A424|nr:DUF4292 domain-containing protein [Flavobacterium sp. BFFFF1]OYU79330.1 MAG: hypothetical protein CFE23_14590 [Flavobacterium sp. BFFFF1]